MANYGKKKSNFVSSFWASLVSTIILLGVLVGGIALYNHFDKTENKVSENVEVETPGEETEENVEQEEVETETEEDVVNEE